MCPCIPNKRIHYLKRMWSMGVDTEPIFDEFILNLKSIDTDSHFDVLFKIIQDRLAILNILLAIL